MATPTDASAAGLIAAADAADHLTAATALAQHGWPVRPHDVTRLEGYAAPFDYYLNPHDHGLRKTFTEPRYVPAVYPIERGLAVLRVDSAKRFRLAMRHIDGFEDVLTAGFDGGRFGLVRRADGPAFEFEGHIVQPMEVWFRGQASGDGWLTGVVVPVPRGSSLVSRGDPLPVVKRAAPTADAERLTDQGNARRLVAKHGKDNRYVPAWRSWAVWDGKRWAKDATLAVERFYKSIVTDLYKAAAAARNAGQVRRGKELLSFAKKSDADARLNSTLALTMSELEVVCTPDVFDRDPYLLNVENGTLDLRTGELRPHRREDLLTKLAPVAYDPSAKAPRFAQFLSEIFPGADSGEMIAFLQRALGYALTGDATEQVLFFCWGQGANGKTVLLETVAALLGAEYALTMRFESLLHSNRAAQNASGDIARLRGVRFVQASEAPSGRGLDTALLKELTGGDTITARRLYQEEDSFKPEFKLFLRANHRPAVAEQTLAFWRRVRVIPFLATIPENQRDPRLIETLVTEASGILAWAVQGAVAWKHGGLRPPQKVIDATEHYRDENDVISEFIPAEARLLPGAWSSTADLYARFCVWWSRTHVHHETPPTRRVFGRLLGERQDLAEGKQGGVRGWKGILLNPLFNVVTEAQS